MDVAKECTIVKHTAQQPKALPMPRLARGSHEGRHRRPVLHLPADMADANAMLTLIPTILLISP